MRAGIASFVEYHLYVENPQALKMQKFSPELQVKTEIIFEECDIYGTGNFKRN